MVYYSLPCRVTAFTDARSMITMFYESGTSVREVWSGDGLSRDARTRCCAPDVVRTSQQQNHILFLYSLQMIIWLLFPLSNLSLPHSLFLSLSLLLARSFSFALTSRKPAFHKSPDHQTIRPERTGPHRTAPHRTVPHRTINSALSLATANCLQPPATPFTAYSQLPHHLLHASRHSFPPPVAP